MNINELTIGEAKQIAGIFGGVNAVSHPAIGQ